MDSARPLIVKRLQAVIPDFKVIRGTANIQAVLRQNWAAPACFVYRNSVKNDDKTGGNLLAYTAVYVALTVTKLEKDDGTVDDSTELLSGQIINSLHGWKPQGKAALAYVGGDAMTDLERNLLFWRDLFTLKHVIKTGGCE